MSLSWRGVSPWKPNLFFFLVKEGKSVLCLEERRKDYVGFLLLGFQCSASLVATIEEAVRSLDKAYFVKSYREDAKVLMVWGDEGVTRPASFWRWLSMQRAARKGLFGSLRAVKEGVGVGWWVSCDTVGGVSLCQIWVTVV